VKGYLSYFKSQLLTGLQYRSAALAGLCTQFFWGFLYAMVFQAFYSHANIDSISYSELMSYVWLNQALFSLVCIRMKDTEIVDTIREGTVAYELCRPYDLYSWWYLKLLAKRYANVALRFIPVIVMAILLPKPYNLGAPYSISSFLLFLVTLLLGSFIVAGINIIIHSICFFTLQDKGITSIINTIAELLSGFDVPLPLLPLIIISISEYLPFRLIGDLPFRIYSGNINGFYVYKCLILQFIWVILLFIIGKLIMKRALKKVCIQGG
jgi:ABC-2 type transport system permease protein